jgi:thiosulfate/3-mercaptopyruvate sulfurtransferase
MLDFSTHPLVEAEWLAAHLSDDDVCIVDARGLGDGTSRELYQRGHIPGATHLDWFHDLSWTDTRGVRNLLLPPESFTAVMEAAGIGDQTRVVVYAETDDSGAARLWWALRFYGHDQVAILNGGWTRWVDAGLPVSTKAPRLSQISSHPDPLLICSQQQLRLRTHYERKIPWYVWSIRVLLSNITGRLSGPRMGACFFRLDSIG